MTNPATNRLFRTRYLMAICGLLWGSALIAQVTIWSEDFNTYGNGTTNAPPKWSSYATDCDDPALNNGNTWGVFNGQFEITDVEGAPCCQPGGGNDNGWLSELIDLSGYCDISISVEVSGQGTFECDAPAGPIFGCDGMSDNSHDQLVVEYALDGGPWTLFPNGYICGGNGFGTIAVSGLNGGNVQIRIRVATKANAESYFFDNILVEGQPEGPISLPALGPYCKNSNPVTLPNPVNGVSGSWSGPGVSGNTFIPANAPGLMVNLTFTPDPGACGTANSTQVTLIPPQPVSLSPLGTYCQTDPPVPLPAIVDGVQGAWSGPGVVGTQFIPAGQSGTVTLTFTPLPTECALPNTTTLTVLTPAPVVLPAMGPYCSEDAPVPLPTEVDGISGNWSGPGVTNNQFDPSAQSGVVSLVFTPNAGQCALAASTDVNVTPLQVPNLPALGPFCESDPPLALDTMPSGITGHWSGPGIANDTFSPTGLADTLVLTFAPEAGQCADTAFAIVRVDTLAAPALPPLGPLCQTDPPLALDTTPSGIAGHWSGPGIANDTLFPATLSGTIALAFVPDSGQCAQADTLLVVVTPPGTPQLASDTLCARSGPYPLAALGDPSFPAGAWSGPGVVQDTLFPDTLSGNVSLTFTPSNSCAQAATTTLLVLPSAMPMLAADTICAADGPFDLTSLADPGLPGSWSGTGVAGNTFTPDSLAGSVLLVYTPDDTCAFAGTTTLTVLQPAQPQLPPAPADTLCANGAPYDLTPLADPNLPGSWSGTGVAGNTFTPPPASALDTISLSYLPDSACASSAQTSLLVAPPPSFSNLSFACDPTNANYTVTFDISGGFGPPYLIDTALVYDTTFTSSPLPSGSSFSFQLHDGGPCDAVVVSGTFNCACTTSAGTLQMPSATPVYACVGDVVSVQHNGDEVLDGNDTLVFVLHTSPGAQLGSSVLVVSSSPAIAWTPTVIPDSVYYISAVAGDFDGFASVDFNDPCLSVSPGVPVVFHAPAATLGPAAPVCFNECTSLAIGLSGFPPFSVVVGVDTGSNTWNDTLGIDTYSGAWTFCPDSLGALPGTYTVQLLEVSDSLCTLSVNGVSQDVTVLPLAQNDYFPTLCPGDTLFVNGTAYHLDNPAGIELITGGAANGCDSIVNVQVQFFTQNPGTLDTTLCPGDALIFNGNTYDFDNPSGTEILPNASWNGCDSVVNVQVQFFTQNPGTLDTTLCPGQSIVINGTTYDANNLTGTEVLAGASWAGCDSVVQVSLQFYDPAATLIDGPLCEGESIVVNGTVYDESNPQGIEVLPGASWTGCDSTIFIDLVFVPPAQHVLDTTLCPGNALIVNGTTYDQQNPMGTEVIAGGSWLGCDSTIFVQIDFYAEATALLDSTLCAGSALVVNGTIYDQQNPTGTEVIAGGSWLGCDSIVEVQLSFLSPAVSYIDWTIPADSSIVVNGTVYDAANPSGTEVIGGGSWTGCDSTIFVSLSFLDFEVFVTPVPPSCFGQFDGMLVIDSVKGAKHPLVLEFLGALIPLDALPYTLPGLGAGTYELTLTDASGLSVTTVVVLPAPPELYLDLGGPIEVFLGESVKLQPTVIGGELSWQWSPPDYLDCTDCPSPTAVMPLSSITYTAVVTDTAGCSASDSVQVVVKKQRALFIPNIFSPDGDGFNDRFYIQAGPEVARLLDFRIYDRWGNLVYEVAELAPNDYAAGWDGSWRDQPAQQGVYVFTFVAEYLDGTTQRYRGDVTLVR